MLNHEHYDFRTLRSWMQFCREAQYVSEAEFARALMSEAQSASPRWKEEGAPGPEEMMPPDPEYVDAIERAVRQLVSALYNYRDTVPRIYGWRTRDVRGD